MAANTVIATFVPHTTDDTLPGQAIRAEFIRDALARSEVK